MGRVVKGYLVYPNMDKKSIKLDVEGGIGTEIIDLMVYKFKRKRRFRIKERDIGRENNWLTWFMPEYMIPFCLIDYNGLESMGRVEYVVEGKNGADSEVEKDKDEYYGSSMSMDVLSIFDADKDNFLKNIATGNYIEKDRASIDLITAVGIGGVAVVIFKIIQAFLAKEGIIL